MKKSVWFFAAVLFMVACNVNDSIEYSGDFRVGEVVEGTLELETPDTFHFYFIAGTYIYGVCNQLSVDVQVSLLDSSGVSLGQFDGPAEGPEPFQFHEIHKVSRYTGGELRLKETGELRSTAQNRGRAGNHPPEKRADQLFYPYSEGGVPGGVVGVIKNGELVFSRAYGMANLTHGDSLTKSILLTNIGSVSKQFTAMAILLLEQQGKLSLEDDVRKHIPELPDLGQVVTLKNMLNHTNGFREVYNLMPMTGWKGEDQLRREEIIEMLKRQEELQAAPGEEYNYNNSAFILLAEIVERISGQSFPGVYERECICSPGDELHRGQAQSGGDHSGGFPGLCS